MRLSSSIITSAVLFLHSALNAQTSLPAERLFEAEAYRDSVVIVVKPGWNMLSMPFQPVHEEAESIFTTATSMPPWKYEGGWYHRDSHLQAGDAFWMKFPTSYKYTIYGYRPPFVQRRLTRGWNFVATLNTPLPVDSIEMNPPGPVLSPAWTYWLGAYVEQAVLQPGVGYWLKVGNSSELKLRSDLIFDFTHEDSVEGEELAIWYSGAMRAPDSLVEALMWDIKYLRERYKDSVLWNSNPVVTHDRFLPPWALSEIYVKFDDTTAQLVRDSLYTGWDVLEPSLRPSWWTPPGVFNSSLLGFEGRLHPVRLAEIYGTLSGVIHAETEWYDFTTISTYPLLIGLREGKLTYCFTLGLRNFDRWGFQSHHGVPNFVGLYIPGQAPPPWYVSEVEFITWDGP